jgi:hypothetical protein
VTIDPRNTPIFGDTVRADPPRPVRLAAGLLLADVALLAVFRLYTGYDSSFPIFLVPLVLAATFAVSARAGRAWARTASTLLAVLLIAGTALLIDYVLLYGIVLLVSAGMQLFALRLLWRADVNGYFTP